MIERVLVTSILILSSLSIFDNSSNRHKELFFFVLFMGIISGNDRFERPTAKRLEVIPV